MYPGSFDPLHLGHLDVIEQAVELFDRVVVMVMHNPEKPSGRFSLSERVDLVRQSVSHLSAVTVDTHPGLAVDAARACDARFIVKGLRVAGDFEVEQQMAHTNWSVAAVRTVYLPGRVDRSFISSRYLRDIAAHGGNVSHLVPEPVARLLQGASSTASQAQGRT
jgi:pantetheine-phosphate adenylyltransferase